MEKLAADCATSFDAFNQLLRREVNGSAETEIKTTLDPRVDPAAPPAVATVDLKPQTQGPSDTVSVKILEARVVGSASVMLHVQNGSGDAYLHSSAAWVCLRQLFCFSKTKRNNKVFPCVNPRLTFSSQGEPSWHLLALVVSLKGEMAKSRSVSRTLVTRP